MPSPANPDGGATREVASAGQPRARGRPGGRLRGDPVPAADDQDARRP